MYTIMKSCVDARRATECVCSYPLCHLQSKKEGNEFQTREQRAGQTGQESDADAKHRLGQAASGVVSVELNSRGR